MTDALNPDRKEKLSSFLDQEAPSTDFTETEHLLKDSFGAQLHYRNLESVSRACQQTGVPIQEHDDFLSLLMARVDGLEQDSDVEDPECLSAWLDGQYDIDSEDLARSETASAVVRNMRSLSQALQALPQPEASLNFPEQVLERIECSIYPDLSSLSAFYDQQPLAEGEVPLDAELLSVTAQEHLSNYETLSHALAHLSVPQPVDFAQRVLAALPEPAFSADFEFCSAYFDEEANAALDSVPEFSVELSNIQKLSTSLQALPEHLASENFLASVMQRVDELVDFELVSAVFDGELKRDVSEASSSLHDLSILSHAIQNLPLFKATEGFADSVMQAIDGPFNFEMLSAAFDGEEKMELYGVDSRQKDLQVLSRALKNLPQFEAPVDFVQGVLAAVDDQPEFEGLSAHFDGALSGSEEQKMSVLAESHPEMKQIHALSRAIQALPQPQPSGDFVARVMLATEQTHKVRLFALPSLLQTRWGQLVAGFAIFGVLALITQSLLTGTEEVASVPGNVIVQVQYQAEDMLFEDVLEDSLENVAENDYNLLIGG